MQLPDMPDVTKAQIISLVTAALTLLVSFGVDISAERQAAILGFVAIVVGILLGSDAAIRRGRAKMVAEVQSHDRGF